MSRTVQLVSPVDGRVLVARRYAEPGAIAAALDLAATAQARWRRTPLSERAAFCSAAVDAMLAMRDEIVPELAWQMGRPVRYGAGELRGFEERARYMIAIAPEALATVEPAPRDGFSRYVRREPLGTVFVIAPWNYPYLTAVNSIVPALMAGNAVILKHATQTLLVGDRFAEAFSRAGLPPGVFQHLVVDHAQAGELIDSGRVQQVNFTGSVPGGRSVARAASDRFLGVGLELGGKDPAYVLPDADLEHAAANLVDGSFFNSGQSCCGIERIYVAESAYPDFVRRFVDITSEYVLGDPLDQATTLGPLVNAEAADFVRRQVAQAVGSGAQALIDSRRFARDAPGSAYMAPQVLIDVDHRMSVMRDESFGPVVGIMPVRDDAHAIALMNDSAFGLTASVWTRDLERAAAIGDEIATGTVFMNRCDYLDPALAWTGVKDSGRGATLSRVGYETLTRPKSYHLRHQT